MAYHYDDFKRLPFANIPANGRDTCACICLRVCVRAFFCTCLCKGQKIVARLVVVVPLSFVELVMVFRNRRASFNRMAAHLSFDLHRTQSLS